MTTEYSIRVPDEVDEGLEGIREEVIETVLVDALELLAQRESRVEEKQDELQARMGIETDDDHGEELTKEEKIEEVQAFLRQKGDRDPRLDY